MTLSTFSDLVIEARNKILIDAKLAMSNSDMLSQNNKDERAIAYADAVTTYLGLVVSRSANTHCSLAIWSQSRDQSVNVFSRQGLPMNWDFPEVNPFAGAAGDFGETSESMSKSIAVLPTTKSAIVVQKDAISENQSVDKFIVSTDPPYYDNIGYADLSDFFYVWLRHSLSNIYPDLFSTMLVPKTHELVALPHRFGGDKNKARQFFESGLGKAFNQMRTIQHPDYPLTIYYAFKQAEAEVEESKNENSYKVIASTGWETMLEGLIQAGFTITGTWPMRTERPTGVKEGINALASSIVLVCRPRPLGHSLK